MERTKALNLQSSVLLIWKNAIFFRAVSLSSLQLSVPSPLWYHDIAFLHGKLPPCLCGKKNFHQEFVWGKGWLQT